ncbi:iron-sulfur cluster assembly 1 homolog, mitochondrial isoform X3 [Sarcophilus harrisii]|uniref:iron-sulfur cluster assembly 1 homolog, mitochondrial isoform X3 n=1 Tax=Sarcophilus harrisii TaxID=9305 RepID=UPI000C79BC89|nr:iron-sulfur cluster assembly 1 homolog, mitochondrial isoform X3 [Sarcophilus harrisii]
MVHVVPRAAACGVSAPAGRVHGEPLSCGGTSLRREREGRRGGGGEAGKDVCFIGASHSPGSEQEEAAAHPGSPDPGEVSVMKGMTPEPFGFLGLGRGKTCHLEQLGFLGFRNELDTSSCE